MAVHPAAAQGFEVGADSYERGRPGYPAEAIAYLGRALGLRPGVRVLDLAAGTGKLTAQVDRFGAQLLGVEPVEAMRRRLVQNVPNAWVIAGTAESLPLENACVDAVVVAQAFHWFEGRRALAEIHRVLRPAGRLALVWNARDDSEDWVAQLTTLIDLHQGGAPRYRSGAWKSAFTGGSLFNPLEETRFRHARIGPPETVVDRVASISFIAALSPVERQETLEAVRQLLATHPSTRGRDEIAFPYRTEVFLFARDAGASFRCG